MKNIDEIQFELQQHNKHIRDFVTSNIYKTDVGWSVSIRRADFKHAESFTEKEYGSSYKALREALAVTTCFYHKGATTNTGYRGITLSTNGRGNPVIKLNYGGKRQEFSIMTHGLESAINDALLVLFTEKGVHVDPRPCKLQNLYKITRSMLTTDKYFLVLNTYHRNKVDVLDMIFKYQVFKDLMIAGMYYVDRPGHLYMLNHKCEAVPVMLSDGILEPMGIAYTGVTTDYGFQATSKGKLLRLESWMINKFDNLSSQLMLREEIWYTR